MDQWPQHPTEPRFSYAAPLPGNPHVFMLSNEVGQDECDDRMVFATNWLTREYGWDKPQWSRHGHYLLKIRSDDMAFHFRMRFC